MIDFWNFFCSIPNKFIQIALVNAIVCALVLLVFKFLLTYVSEKSADCVFNYVFLPLLCLFAISLTIGIIQTEAGKTNSKKLEKS